MIDVTSPTATREAHLRQDGNGLSVILGKIRRQTGIDFRPYRSEVLKRRIRQRLDLTRCPTYWEYILLLNRDPHEYDRLIETLTIKVSRFFRDPESFAFLAERVVPEILTSARARRRKRIRIWSCGAACGQEAYTVAILVSEVLGGSPRDFDVKILATDIDRAALHQARWGSYERDALTGIGPHILFKYFTPGGGRYAVNDRARSMVDFKYHDVTSDVQLSGMDLVICKNLLIYLQKESRERALANLSHAVNPGGFLVLGKTESLDSPAADRFDVVSSRDRVYRKLQPRSPAAHPAPGQQKRGVTL